ncbi:MAG: AtuA-related protein [bacterium]
MRKIKLSQIAYARSGDKGEASNAGIVAYDRAGYELLKRVLTPGSVKAHFRKICRGPVERYEVDNIFALNFILHDSLGGGGSESLKSDAQGKTHGLGLLQMEIEVPDDFVDLG